eukprot:jgi/Psemu1/9705/gm1.9705_g
MSGTILSRTIWLRALLVVLFASDKLYVEVRAFTTSPPFARSPVALEPPSVVVASETTTATTTTALFAAKKKKNKAGGNKKSGGGVPFGGFGGAAMEPCPCGAGETYSSCCSKVHKDVQNFRKASAEQIVRARYSAYSRKLPEFLMMSTHPNNKAFNPDLRKWKEDIKLNMYDNFDLSNCVIVEEQYNEPASSEDETETATVKFIAEMVLKETGETTSFMETSTFERAKNSGAWLYLSGEIEAAPGDEDEESGDEDISVEEKLASQL